VDLLGGPALGGMRSQSFSGAQAQDQSSTQTTSVW